jgi:hypothetical protein
MPDKAPNYEIPLDLRIYDDVRGGRIPTDVTPDMVQDASFLSPVTRGLRWLWSSPYGRWGTGAGLAAGAYGSGMFHPSPQGQQGQGTQQAAPQETARQAPVRQAPAARQGEGAAVQAPQQPPQEDAQAGERRRLQEARDRLVANQERGGLTPMDIAIIQLGLGMMGSSRASPLAAMSDAAAPAINTYVNLTRSEQDREERRQRRADEMDYREAMLARYDADRASREQLQRERLAQAMAVAGMRRAGGGGGASRSALVRSLETRLAGLIAGAGANMSPQERNEAIARTQRAIQAARAGAMPEGQSDDPIGLR